MRYAIHYEEDAPNTEATIFLEDGGIATIHHNGEHLLTTMYQDKVEIFDGEMWEALAEGKTYTKSWKSKQTIDQEIIDYALEWLCPFCEGFIHVEFYNLVSEYNHNQFKKQADL